MAALKPLTNFLTVTLFLNIALVLGCTLLVTNGCANGKFVITLQSSSKVNSNDFDGLPFYDEHSEQLYFISMQDGNQVMKTINLPKSVLKQE